MSFWETLGLLILTFTGLMFLLAGVRAVLSNEKKVIVSTVLALLAALLLAVPMTILLGVLS